MQLQTPSPRPCKSPFRGFSEVERDSPASWGGEGEPQPGSAERPGRPELLPLRRDRRGHRAPKCRVAQNSAAVPGEGVAVTCTTRLLG